MGRELEGFDDLIADFQAFKAEHTTVTCPKTFYVYIVKDENVWGDWKRQLVLDLQKLGFAYSREHQRFYWHNHLNLNAVLDIRDNKLIDAVLYPAKGRVVDLG